MRAIILPFAAGLLSATPAIVVSIDEPVTWVLVPSPEAWVNPESGLIEDGIDLIAIDVQRITHVENGATWTDARGSTYDVPQLWVDGAAYFPISLSPLADAEGWGRAVERVRNENPGGTVSLAEYLQ